MEERQERINYCPYCSTPTEDAGLGDYEVCPYCGWNNFPQGEKSV